VKLGCRVEQQTSQTRNNEAKQYPILIAYFIDRIAIKHRNGKINYRADKVSAKEGELYQHGLGVVQFKHLLHIGDENVVEDCHETPHKEQESQADKCGSVIGGLVFWIHCRIVKMNISGKYQILIQ
jgi:hypothetical protein